MVNDVGRIKKIFMACLIAAGYWATMPVMAEFGPMCSWPFKPFNWLGHDFFCAFCDLCTKGFFNNYGNAGFW